MQKLINIRYRPNYNIVFLLIVFLFLIWYSLPQKMLHSYQECTKKYPIKKIYTQLSKTHYWRIYSKPFMEIESYIDNRKDGVSLYYGNLDDRSKNIFMGVSQIHFDKRDGAALDYINEKLYHNNPVQGISTMKALALANAEGQNITHHIQVSVTLMLCPKKY